MYSIVAIKRQSMSAEQSTLRLLNSWKEIASYLGRGIRTVQRWEKMGLPVRRLGSGHRSPVVADARDLDRWIQAAQRHGFTTPQSAERILAGGALRDSVERAHGLQKNLITLCESQRSAVQQLAQTIAALEKSCQTNCSMPPHSLTIAKHDALADTPRTAVRRAS